MATGTGKTQGVKVSHSHLYLCNNHCYVLDREAMKEYIGDGVYADHDGYGIVLTTEDGYAVTNRIVLEPDVYLSLVNWIRRLNETNSTQENKQEAS